MLEGCNIAHLGCLVYANTLCKMYVVRIGQTDNVTPYTSCVVLYFLRRPIMILQTTPSFDIILAKLMMYLWTHVDLVSEQRPCCIFVLLGSHIDDLLDPFSIQIPLD